MSETDRPAPMVETHDLVKIYPDGEVRALDGVDLTVGPG